MNQFSVARKGEGNVAYTVFGTRKSRVGDTQLLIYDGEEWLWVSAKDYYPVSAVNTQMLDQVLKLVEESEVYQDIVKNTMQTSDDEFLEEHKHKTNLPLNGIHLHGYAFMADGSEITLEKMVEKFNTVGIEMNGRLVGISSDGEVAGSFVKGGIPPEELPWD
ncbi:hypothetical protein SP15_250 [Bacillus phage SP-15]|uniref:Uncharacterized protein n=1 Tax=Bacillus phage SP-15 TaxID=1792032 RepID=A0A127AWN3_9CAUD|nr:hypothetical protein SP15_250 [Bacillus phage SP-15]AMM45055.1 hypothetical protein SP15_250 [Bacillus phage SP-15]